MNYLLITDIHVYAAMISISGFILRGIWMLQNSALLNKRWVKILPHVIDTALLASAIALVVLSHQYPLMPAWLNAKTIALVVYIGLGMIALRRGRTRKMRALAFVAAVITFAYIYGVARTRTIVPLFF